MDGDSLRGGSFEKTKTDLPLFSPKTFFYSAQFSFSGTVCQFVENEAAKVGSLVKAS
jgi:hypothetical protein